MIGLTQQRTFCFRIYVQRRAGLALTLIEYPGNDTDTRICGNNFHGLFNDSIGIESFDNCLLNKTPDIRVRTIFFHIG